MKTSPILVYGQKILEASQKKLNDEQVKYNCDLLIKQYKPLSTQSQQTLENQLQCTTCDFKANFIGSLASHNQAEHDGGVMRTPVGVGFMVSGESSSNSSTSITEETGGAKKRKYRAEYVKASVKVKTFFSQRNG